MSKDISKEIRTFAEHIGENKKILDVGCGARPFETFFKNSTYTGIDVEVSGRESGDKKPDTYYDGLHIPYEEKSFDIVICTQVLEHCIDEDQLLAEMYRVLKTDGILFLSVPFMWGEHEIPFDFRRFSSFGIKKKVEHVGFTIQSFKKITGGVKAIETIVNSEINHDRKRPPKIKVIMMNFLWRALLRLWKSSYNFERVYLDNLIIAKK